MKPIYLSILTLILAGVVSYATTKAVAPTSSASTVVETKVKKSDESVYDRVIRTGKIRCGFYVAPPYFNKDPVTGDYSGIWYEYVEELGRIFNLEIDWRLEVGLGDLIEALQSNKIDAYCAGLWNNPARAKQIDFVEPISYQVLHAYVRGDDKRFDQNLQAVNSEEIKVACIDGEMADLIAQTDFPKAKRPCSPQLSPYTDLVMNIVTGKSDITFTTPALIIPFNENNPDKRLRRVDIEYPIRIFPESLALKYGENEFRRMLNHGTKFLISSGKIDSILTKYEDEYGYFYRTVKPYETAK